MGRLAIHPSAALARLIRDRRTELGLSLREVQQQTEALGQPIPFTTLARVEQGKVDPGVKRLHLLLRLYHLPVQMAADLLDMEQFSGDLPDESVSPEQLYRNGIEHWKAGRLREGIAHLMALRSRRDEVGSRHSRQRALLSFAIAAGSMGKYRVAGEIVQELLLQPPEPELLVSVLIQAAVSWHWLGSGEAALAFLSQAETHLAQGDHKQRAWVDHERASTLLSMGHLDAAAEALDAALGHYRSAGDTYGESRAMGVEVRLARERGDAEQAHRSARQAREHAERHGFERLRMMRRLDEGRALLELGERLAGIEALEEALGLSTAAHDNVLRFYSHHALWMAHVEIGDRVRAKFELLAAQYDVRFVDETTPEVSEVRATIKPARRR